VISEGDRISMIANVDGAEQARQAEAEGTAALVVRGELGPVRAATGLPILWSTRSTLEDAHREEADAYVLALRDLDDDGELERVHAQAGEWGIDCVVAVADEDEVERALERVDPEIFLVAVPGEEDGGLERVLDLLADVPAGKLAIAELERPRPEDVDELERAGYDAVVVAAGDLPALAGDRPAEG
jgi:indole-3-glycerol phosphate synthase